MPKMGKNAWSSGCKLGGEPQEQPDGQTDHIGDVALDSGDQCGAQPLHRIPAGPPLPLAAGEIRVDQLGRELAEGDATRLDTGPDLELPIDSVWPDQRERSEHLMGPAGE